MTSRVGIPSLENLKQLPPWALVAFAARCARRSIASHWRVLSKDEFAQVDDAVSIAEKAAETGEPDYDRSNLPMLQHAATSACVSVVIACASSVSWATKSAEYERLEDVCKAAYHAALVAAVVHCFSEKQGTNTPEQTLIMMRDGGVVSGPQVDAIWSDYEVLLGSAQTKQWTNASTVPRDLFPTIPNATPGKTVPTMRDESRAWWKFWA